MKIELNGILQLCGEQHAYSIYGILFQGALNYNKWALFYIDTISYTNCHHSGSSAIIRMRQVYLGLSRVSVNFIPISPFPQLHHILPENKLEGQCLLFC